MAGRNERNVVYLSPTTGFTSTRIPLVITARILNRVKRGVFGEFNSNEPWVLTGHLSCNLLVRDFARAYERQHRPKIIVKSCCSPGNCIFPGRLRTRRRSQSATSS
jgi:hypothetical protein